MQGSGGAKPKKKSRNDLIRSAVGSFLKETGRVGTEKYRKSDFVLSQNKTEFVFNTMLQSDLCGGGNSFSYSNVVCTTNNFHLVDQQFARFSQFVESQTGYIRSELRRFYGPMICHLYIDLLKAREAKPAADFIKKYAHLVAPVETYEAPLPTKINGCSVANQSHHQAESPSSAQNTCIKFSEDLSTVNEPEKEYCMRLIQMLSACSKLEALEADSDIALFRSSKFEIQTLEEVVEALRTYFAKRGHVLILNLIYTWIHVHIIDNEIHKWTEDVLFLQLQEEDDMQDLGEQNVHEIVVDKDDIKSHPMEEETTEKEEEAEDINLKDMSKECEARFKMKQLPKLREKILASQIEQPKFFKIPEKNGRIMTTADLDADECHMVAGFNNSVVQLWQLNQVTCAGRNLYQRFANKICRWEINNCYEEEEDEIEIDIEMDARTGGYESKGNKFNEAKYEDNSINEYGGVELRGHGEGVTDVRFSRHSPLIFSVSKDSTMRAWRAENYTTAAIYRGRNYPIWCFDESPVGQYVATGSEDLTARLWSLERDYPQIAYVGHTQAIECIAFHPNGNYLATGSTDSSVRLWCVTSGKLMRVFADCKEPVTSIAFSHDGKMLAAGGEEPKIRIFDLAGGSQLCEIKDQTSCVNSLAFSANDEHLASVNQDGHMHLWNMTKCTSGNDGPSTSSTASTTPSSSSSSITPTCVLTLNYECPRLVKVLYTPKRTLCCIGG